MDPGLASACPPPTKPAASSSAPGVPVVDLIRTAYAGEIPVEVFISVVAGDKHVFQYDFPAPD